MKNKSLVFPKMGEGQSMDMIRNMQDNRKLVWGEKREIRPIEKNGSVNSAIVKHKEPSINTPKKIEKDDFAVNNVIRQAKENQ